MQTVYMKTFASRDAADTLMILKNRACKAAGNRKDLYVVVDGPGSKEFTVMDLKTAIDGGFTYSWKV